MAKKITKPTKRRLFLIMILTLAIVLAFSYNLWTMISQVMEKNNEAADLRKQMNHLEDEEDYLKVEVEKLNDPDYVARYARERYLYSKDGEFTIRIPEAQ
jgi:cell division protein DivIC